MNILSSKRQKKINTFCLFLFAFFNFHFLFISYAQAGGFLLNEWSARAMSLGGGEASGMVARADDAAAVGFNSAGITQIPGMTIQFGSAVSMLNLDIHRKDGAPAAHSSDQVWPLPQFFLTYQLNDRVWLGFGSFIRYGLGSQFPDNWGAAAVATPETLTFRGLGNVQASAILKSVTLVTNTFNPSIAYKINDIWSISAGFNYTWGYFSYNQQYNIGKYGGVLAHSDARIHSENGYAFGFNLGIHAKFNDRWSAGLAYRSREIMSFSGSLRFRNSGFMGQMLSAVLHNTKCDGKLNVPDVFAFGLMYKPLPNLSIEGDISYTVWSRYRNLIITMDRNDMPNLMEQKNWHDTWGFSLSVEYRPLDWLALRAGFTYETSPLKNSAYPDYLVPVNGRNYYTVGVGINHGNWTFDIAYMYLRLRELNYPNNQVNSSGFITEYAGKATCGHASNIGLTIGYKF